MSTKKLKLPDTWEQFCKETGRDPKKLPDVSKYDDADKNNAIANYKLPLIIKHCNEKFLESTGSDQQTVDYFDTSKWKYEPRWIVKATKTKPSGVGLSYHAFGRWVTVTRCGPRFAFVDTVPMYHVTKKFKKLYEDLYL